MTNTRTMETDPGEPLIYQIRIKGHLSRHWSDWFGGLTSAAQDLDEMLLTGAVVDQAALHGLLKKVRDLGLPPLSVSPVQPGQAEASSINETYTSHSRKEEHMQTTNKTAETRDRKAMLSLLWIFVMFNFTYADILTLYFNTVLQKQAWELFQSGSVGSVHITQGFVLLGAILLETAIAMVLLSRVLKYRANRWANIIVAVIQLVATVQSLTGPLYWNLYYALFAAIEIACLLFVIWYAWTWRQPEGAVLTSSQSRV